MPVEEERHEPGALPAERGDRVEGVRRALEHVQLGARAESIKR